MKKIALAIYALGAIVSMSQAHANESLAFDTTCIQNNLMVKISVYTDENSGLSDENARASASITQIVKGNLVPNSTRWVSFDKLTLTRWAKGQGVESKEGRIPSLSFMQSVYEGNDPIVLKLSRKNTITINQKNCL